VIVALIIASPALEQPFEVLLQQSVEVVVAVEFADVLDAG
jgi:hypothetical protein